MIDIDNRPDLVDVNGTGADVGVDSTNGHYAPDTQTGNGDNAAIEIRDNEDEAPPEVKMEEYNQAAATPGQVQPEEIVGAHDLVIDEAATTSGIEVTEQAGRVAVEPIVDIDPKEKESIEESSATQDRVEELTDATPRAGGASGGSGRGLDETIQGGADDEPDDKGGTEENEKVLVGKIVPEEDYTAGNNAEPEQKPRSLTVITTDNRMPGATYHPANEVLQQDTYQSHPEGNESGGNVEKSAVESGRLLPPVPKDFNSAISFMEPVIPYEPRADELRRQEQTPSYLLSGYVDGLHAANIDDVKQVEDRQDSKLPAERSVTYDDVLIIDHKLASGEVLRTTAKVHGVDRWRSVIIDRVVPGEIPDSETITETHEYAEDPQGRHIYRIDIVAIPELSEPIEEPEDGHPEDFVRILGKLADIDPANTIKSGISRAEFDGMRDLVDKIIASQNNGGVDAATKPTEIEAHAPLDENYRLTNPDLFSDDPEEPGHYFAFSKPGPGYTHESVRPYVDFLRSRIELHDYDEGKAILDTYEEIFGPQREISGNDSRHRYFEYSWPDDPAKQLAARSILHSQLIVNPKLLLGKDDLILAFESTQRKVAEILKAKVGLEDSGIDEQPILDFYQKLGLATCPIMAISPARLDQSFWQRYLIGVKAKEEDPGGNPTGHYLTRLNLGLVDLEAVARHHVDPNSVALHEQAHVSDPRSKTIIRAPEGGIYVIQQHSMLFPKAFREARASLLEAHGQSFIGFGQRSNQIARYVETDNSETQNKIWHFLPGMYVDRATDGSKYIYPLHSAINAVNLELLIAKDKDKRLLDALLHVNDSDDAQYALKNAFDEIQPGLSERWQSASVNLSAQAEFYYHILKTIWGVDLKSDFPKRFDYARSIIYKANRFTHNLILDKLYQPS